MSLPVLIQHLARNRIGAYCQRRIPDAEREKIRLDLRFEDDNVILVESRPSAKTTGDWQHLDVARFRYSRASGSWMLDAPSFNPHTPWRPYSSKPQRDLERLLTLLDEDSDGIFWA